MKILHALFTALIGAAALTLGAPFARATLTYTPGDLFLGFRSSSDAQDYLVNLGNVSQFANLSAGSTITVNTSGSISSSLVTAFGSGWFSSGEVFWSISGTTFVDETTPAVLYATKARFDLGTQSTPWVGRSNTAQIGSVSEMQALAQKYATEGVASGSTKGTFQDATATNSYAYFTSQINDFGVGGSIEGSFANGTAGSKLDLYQINPVYGQQATYLGSFTINDSGVIQFTAAAVPEPSSFGLFVVSAAIVTVILRRRSKATSRL